MIYFLLRITVRRNISMLITFVPLASGILHDSENITMQLERQLVYNVK